MTRRTWQSLAPFALTAIMVGCGSTSAPAPTGNLYITVSFAAVRFGAQDADGVDIVVDSRPPHHALAAADTMTVTGLAIGQHSVRLDGVASNCVLGAPNPQTPTVYVDSTIVVLFSAVCS